MIMELPDGDTEQVRGSLCFLGVPVLKEKIYPETNNHCLIIQVKITTFQHIHFYLLFDVSSDTTLIVKKLL